MSEHVAFAMPWQIEMVKRHVEINNVAIVDFDFCCCGMKLPNDDRLVKKRTRVMTNSPCLIKCFGRAQCTGGHDHAHLICYQAHRCQVYPE